MNILLYNEWDSISYCWNKCVLLKVQRKDKILFREARGFILFAVIQDPGSLLNLQWEWQDEFPRFRIESIIYNESIKLRTKLPKKEFEKLNTIEVIIVNNAIYTRLLEGKNSEWNSIMQDIGKLVKHVFWKVGIRLNGWIKGFGKSLQ